MNKSEEENANILGSWSPNSNNSKVSRDIKSLVKEQFMRAALIALEESEIRPHIATTEELHDIIIDATQKFMDLPETTRKITTWTSKHETGYSSYVGIDHKALTRHIAVCYLRYLYDPLCSRFSIK